tara:strand:+ start:1707 stop:2528 length:822 start_codon:yes stop_codon:yes gene_type:complete
MAIFTNLYYAYNSSKSLGVPFSNFEIKGDTHWTSTAGFRQIEDAPEKRKALYLDDIDISRKKSGAATMTVAEGYKVRLLIFTENHKYFTDNTKSTPAANDVRIDSAGLGFDETLEVVMFGGDYLSIDVDEEHSGIYRYRLSLNGEFYNIKDPEEINDETWIELKEARLIDGDEEEQEAEFIPVSDDETIIVVDDEEVLVDEEEGTVEDIETEDDEGEEEGEGEGEKESNGMSWKGVLIIGAVVIGLVLLLRMNRKSSGSSSTKSPSEGGSSGE